MSHPSAPPFSSLAEAHRAATALQVVDQISALVAYWDTHQHCVFANAAYHDWFGRSPSSMAGISLQELLGPLYEKNRPYIEGALAGVPQVFERQIPLPGGGTRDSITSYTPEIVNGRVIGFSVHVADVTALRQREGELARAIREAVQALEKTKDSFRSKDLGHLRLRLEAVLERLQGA